MTAEPLTPEEVEQVRYRVTHTQGQAWAAVWKDRARLLATLDARTADPGGLREAVERIVGNGPGWASQYAYEVLVEALALTPEATAPDRWYCDACGNSVLVQNRANHEAGSRHLQAVGRQVARRNSALDAAIFPEATAPHHGEPDSLVPDKSRATPPGSPADPEATAPDPSAWEAFYLAFPLEDEDGPRSADDYEARWFERGYRAAIAFPVATPEATAPELSAWDLGQLSEVHLTPDQLKVMAERINAHFREDVKLIRLTDDRYILDAGPEVRPEQMEVIKDYFAAWWAKHAEYPMTFVIGGVEQPIEYEDRRTSDLEGRVARLEAHFHYVGLLDKTDPPTYRGES